jgi:transcriptional regulator with XRE-family HTH domain
MRRLFREGGVVSLTGLNTLPFYLSAHDTKKTLDILKRHLYVCLRRVWFIPRFNPNPATGIAQKGSCFMKGNDKTKSQISELIAASMKEKGLSIRQLAEKLDVVYETVRGIVTGNTVPSPYLVKAVADALGEDQKEWEQLAVSDRIRAKWGKIPMEIAGKNPELEPIEREWKHLSEEHKQDIIAMIQTYAKRDRRAR